MDVNVCGQDIFVVVFELDAIDVGISRQDVSPDVVFNALLWMLIYVGAMLF